MPPRKETCLRHPPAPWVAWTLPLTPGHTTSRGFQQVWSPNPPLFCSPVQLGDKDESEGQRVMSTVRAKTVCVCVCMYMYVCMNVNPSCVYNRMTHV